MLEEVLFLGLGGGGLKGLAGGLLGFREGGLAVDEPGREERGEENENEGEMDEEEAEEAGFEEEGEGFVLDDFFRGADFLGEGFEHGGAGATEANAKSEGRGGLEGGGKGGRVEAETDIGRFSNVALEINSSLFGVVNEVGGGTVGLEVCGNVV